MAIAVSSVRGTSQPQVSAAGNPSMTLMSHLTSTMYPTSVNTAPSQRQATLIPAFGRARSQMDAKARVRARERLVAETNTSRVPMTPKALPALFAKASCRTISVSSGTPTASVMDSLVRLPSQAAAMIRIGNTETNT